MFWHRRRDGRIYVYCHSNNKMHALPRFQVRHLDEQPDSVVEAYVADLRARAQSMPPKPTTAELPPKMADLVARFHVHLEARGLDPNTVYNKTAPLLQHAIPLLGSAEPHKWVFEGPRLLPRLRERGLSDTSIIRTNGALSGFWKWLREEGLVAPGQELLLRRPRQMSKPTPLAYVLKPEDVLNFACDTRRPEDVTFLALCGFFFSLRPQESFGLTRADFVAGSGAGALECCKVMASSGLFGRLAVRVSRQRSKTTGQLKDPKAHSTGWVACFDERAARAIVGMLSKVKDAKAPVLCHGPDYLTKRWAREGLAGVTLKDLRRASLYWLGHHGGVGLIQLKNHARHAKAATTELYLRRPDEMVAGFGDGILDLDI